MILIDFYHGYSDEVVLETRGYVAPVRGDAVVIGDTKYIVAEVCVVYDPYNSVDNLGNLIPRHKQRACVSLKTVCPANHAGMARTERNFR